MKKIFVLDACALIALLALEQGADIVENILQEASNNKVILMMNKLNLLEVYYGVLREYGKFLADELLAEIKNNPIKIISEISDSVFTEAARLKVLYKISLADSIVLAEASVSGGMVVTSDHHEFDIIEKEEKISFLWIR